MIILWSIGNTVFPDTMTFTVIMLQSVIMIITVGLATYFLFYLGFLYKFSTSIGKVWFAYGFGFLGFTLGDIIYTYYESFTSEPPFPSVADFFYLIGYIPLILGVIIHSRLLKKDLLKFEKVAIGIGFTLISVLVIATTIILPIIEWYDGFLIPIDEFWEIIIAMSYPILDLAFLFFVILLLVKLRHGKINFALILLLLGFFFNAIGDILFNWVTNVIGEEKTFELFDLLILIGDIFICASTISVIHLMRMNSEELNLTMADRRS
ncbi:MAG: hypothetical protein ACXACO_09875 [Promethearchaeota archaeon]